MVLHPDAYLYLLLFESTAQAGAEDIERGEIVSGVQAVSLKQRTEALLDKVTIRSLDQVLWTTLCSTLRAT